MKKPREITRWTWHQQPEAEINYESAPSLFIPFHHIIQANTRVLRFVDISYSRPGSIIQKRKTHYTIDTSMYMYTDLIPVSCD